MSNSGRGYTGFLGLVGRFFFGWLFTLMALVPIAGAPDAQRALIGTGDLAHLGGVRGARPSGPCSWAPA